VCACGTMDDDGERMISCDTCHHWSHTRCAGFPDDLDQPRHFLCANCLQQPPAETPPAGTPLAAANGAAQRTSENISGALVAKGL